MIEEKNINTKNEYWRQAAPLNDDIKFKKAMKIIREEKIIQLKIDIEDYERENF